MTSVFPVALQAPHRAFVHGTSVPPYRFWATCTHGGCGWTGERWRSTRLAEAEAKLHELTNCPHDSIESWARGMWQCLECGVPVTVENVDGVVRIVAAPDE